MKNTKVFTYKHVKITKSFLNCIWFLNYTVLFTFRNQYIGFLGDIYILS